MKLKPRVNLCRGWGVKCGKMRRKRDETNQNAKLATLQKCVSSLFAGPTVPNQPIFTFFFLWNPSTIDNCLLGKRKTSPSH